MSSIAFNRFAMPEIVEHGVTDLLLDDMSATALADSMVWMLENESSYQEMRRHARASAATHYSKAAFESKIHALIRRSRYKFYPLGELPCLLKIKNEQTYAQK